MNTLTWIKRSIMVFTLAWLMTFLARCDSPPAMVHHQDRVEVTPARFEVEAAATFEARVKAETVQNGLTDGHPIGNGSIQNGIPTGSVLVGVYLSTEPDPNLQNRIYVGYQFTHSDPQYEGQVFYPTFVEGGGKGKGKGR